jgi:flagellar hook-associated protein FlgK
VTSVSSIALSGMQAAQAALNTAAHNVANVSTPAFRRQEVIQSTQQGGGVTLSPGRSANEGSALEADMVEFGGFQDRQSNDRCIAR